MNTERNTLNFLTDGGELGELTRNYDWQGTPIGVPAEWPQSLRTAVGIMLHSRFAMFIFWGPELTCFYNDAYRVFLGEQGKHPFVLGKPGEVAFPEAWPIIKPLIDGVLAGGPSYYTEDQLVPIYRNGRLEEVYWTFCLDPMYDETGNINGIFATASDTTEKVLRERELNENQLIHEERINEEVNYRLEIEKSAAYFRELTDTVPTIIWITNEHGYCTYLNKHWYDLTGQTTEEAEGFGWLDAIHPDDFTNTGVLFNEANSKQTSFRSVYRLRVKGGNYRWVIDSGSPKTGMDGRYEGMIGTVGDIHEQVMAQEEQKQFAQEIQTSAERLNLAIAAGELGLFEINTKTGIIYPSDRFREIFDGLASDRASDYVAMLHQLDAAARLQSHELGRQTGAIDYTTRVTWRNGKVHWVRIKGIMTVDANKEPLRIRGIAQDITDLKELEAHKDSFLGIASHELKTPVTSIKAYAQVMEQQFRKTGELIYAQMMERIDKQVNRLNYLISDLLDVTKMNSGNLELNFTEFNPDELAREVVDDMQRISSMHTIILRTGFDSSIVSDRERLSQVLTNLINNAIKYSPGENRIWVYTQDLGGSLHVSVIDHGIGVREDQREQVFEQFFRVKGDRGHNYPGLGLGLYISAGIIKRMGGRIWVEPGKEKGSLFCFTVPVNSTASGNPV
ncbi:MAG: PAS domain S-box protein [Chitinophagaceae bacterium]|nr:MAG: PAS domain S-box protein [Chitinophagaceae bacterium]